MVVQDQKDLDGLKRIGQIVGECLQIMLAEVKPGITTAELNAVGAAFLKKQGARSAPIVTYKYPGDTCISINDEAAHGIPGKRMIKAGDLVNVDVSAEKDGYFADTGASIPVPPILPATQFLCDATLEALHAALDAVREGERFSVIGRSVEAVAKKHDLRLIRELGGHGIGRALHEHPRNVPNYFTNRAKDRMVNGLVMTIEPFLTPGHGRIFTESDGWTLRTTDGEWAAQYEHTIVITHGKPLLITKVA
jgi:methionyl aminopeptidase